MTRKIVGGDKDEHGIFLPKAPASSAPPTIEPSDISIDDLMTRGLKAIYGLMRAIEADIGTGAPERNTVMNLKDAMAMLKDLKKEESEWLNRQTDEQLEQMLNK